MKKNYLDFDNLINHPLFELATSELTREGELTTRKEGHKLIYNINNSTVLFAKIIIKMHKLISLAHKNGQKEKLDNYIKENLNVRTI